MWQLSCEDDGAKDFKAFMFAEDVGGAGEITREGCCLSPENNSPIYLQQYNPKNNEYFNII